MKVAFVNQPWNLCPSPQAGSISIWTHEIARRIARHSDVVVYAREGNREPASEIRDGIAFRRFSVRRDHHFHRLVQRAVPAVLRRPLFATGLYYPLYARRVAEDIAAQGCDIVHVQSFSQIALTIKKRNPRARIILHMHCDWLESLEFRAAAKRLRVLDRIIGCSDHISEGIRERFPDMASRCHTIYNGVHYPWPDTHREWRRDGDGDRLLFVGRISPEKGLHVLLRAFERVWEKRPLTRLTIVGPEAVASVDFLLHGRAGGLEHLRPWFTKDYLATLKRMLPGDIASRVEYAGAVPQRDLGYFYAGSDLLVNPSFAESFGMSLVEAMVHRLPVIASDVGGIPEIVIPEETGLLVPAGDEAALSFAILDLLADPQRRARMGQAGHDRAVRMFTWDRIARDVREMYEEVGGSGGK